MSLDCDYEVLDPKSRLALTSGNGVLSESEVPIVHELLNEALHDLDVIEQMISLVKIVHDLLAQTVSDQKLADDLVLHPLSTSSGPLLVLREMRILRVAKFHAALAPHKKLPPEILAEIFLLSCHGDNLRLSLQTMHWCRAFTQVCKRWRQVALNDPRLWNNITLKMIDDVDPRFADWVAIVFARSAGKLISLKIDAFKYIYNPLKATPITAIVLPHLDRFRALSLTIPSICLSPLFELSPGFADSLEYNIYRFDLVFWCMGAL
jgi:hypothetical protein